MPFTWASTATVCIGSATPLAVTTYGTIARLTVVTLTGTVGLRGGSFFEQAEIAVTASAAMHAREVRVLIDWSGLVVCGTLSSRSRMQKACRRSVLIPRRRARVAPGKCTTASVIEPAAPSQRRVLFAR